MPQVPNILFIMSDDHAAHAISAYTKDSPLHPHLMDTPNIDRIAREGMLFDNCFCTNSICAPSRATILTGTYNHINGVTTLATKLDNSILTFPTLLHQNGYQTAIVGKWHLGHGEKFNPRGFDYWEILPGHGTYHNPVMIKNGRMGRHAGYVTDIVTDLGLNWLKNRDKSRPFLLMLHHKAPHRSWEPDKKYYPLFSDIKLPLPKTFYDDYSNRAAAASHARMRVAEHLNSVDLKVSKHRLRPKILGYLDKLQAPAEFTKYKLYDREHTCLQFKDKNEFIEWKYQAYMKDYMRCIKSLDDNIGRTLKYLDDAGLAENTIVIYTSDQGFFLGDHGWYDKRFMYEESLRMPFIIRYPKEIAPDSRCKDMILNVDFAETFLDYAGIPNPSEMQGTSFRSLLQGKTPANWQKALYYRYWMNGSDHAVYAHYGLRTHRYKLIYYYCDPCGQTGARVDAHEPEWELFDLEEDPFELKNVYHDLKYQTIVQELTMELARLQREKKDIPFDAKK